MRQEVLKGFRRGDPDAVSELFSSYGGAVFTVAMSILRDRELAAEATQQTFIKAWRNSGSYDVGREFAPWLYAIARRTAIDIWRAERRRDTRTVDDRDMAIEMPHGIESIWEAFEVRAALHRLTDEEREVIELTHYLGYTHVAAAETLDVAVGTIKSRSHRAHQKLAQYLSHLIES